MTERMQDRAIECQSVGTPEVGEGLKTVRLVPDGITESTNGRFLLDAEAAALMIEGFDRRGLELVIDFEHQTLGGAYSAPSGQAPAAGWITKLWYERDRGVLALVRWNPKTRDAIREGSYGYVSPVLIIRKIDGKAIGLHSVGVTNRPAIPRLERLAASQNTGTETETMTTEMNVSPIITELAGLIGMPVKSDTTATAVLTACRDRLKALAADDSVGIAQHVRTALGLPSGADKDAVTLALSVRTGVGAASAELAAIETELAVLKAQIHNQEAEQWVGAYSAKGVVGIGSNDAERKADREMILRMACSNRADCERVLQQRLAFLPPSGVTNPPTGRQTTIIESEREYRGNVGHQKATSLVAFVSNALREKGLGKLSEQETSELSIG